MITDETNIAAGEELALEAAPKTYNKRRTDVLWKDDVAVAAKAAKAEAKATASSKAASSTAIESEV